MGLQCRQFSFEGKTFEHYYLCNYKPIRAGADSMSQSLIKFKQGVKLHVEAWSECAVQELVKKNLGTTGIIVRARRSVESNQLHLEDSPLVVLCNKLAREGTGVYVENLLIKTRATISLKGLSMKERELEMKNVYQLNPDSMKAPRRDNILLIDDIYTTGATVRSILRALLLIKNKPSVKIFTLAFTDYGSDLNRDSKLTSGHYNFVPEFGWSIVAEEPMREFNFEALTRMILHDNFE